MFFCFRLLIVQIIVTNFSTFQLLRIMIRRLKQKHGFPSSLYIWLRVPVVTLEFVSHRVVEHLVIVWHLKIMLLPIADVLDFALFRLKTPLHRDYALRPLQQFLNPFLCGVIYKVGGIPKSKGTVSLGTLISLLEHLPPTLCKKVCIGETGRRLGERFREHLRDVEKDDKNASKQVARHLESP